MVLLALISACSTGSTLQSESAKFTPGSIGVARTLVALQVSRIEELEPTTDIEARAEKITGEQALGLLEENRFEVPSVFQEILSSADESQDTKALIISAADREFLYVSFGRQLENDFEGIFVDLETLPDVALKRGNQPVGIRSGEWAGCAGCLNWGTEPDCAACSDYYEPAPIDFRDIGLIDLGEIVQFDVPVIDPRRFAEGGGCRKLS